MSLWYFEDIPIGQKTFAGKHQTTRDEILEFSQKWDRLPFHIDEEATKDYPYGSLIAPAPYILAMISRVWTTASDVPLMAVVGHLGYDKIRIPNPVRPGDLLNVVWEVVEKRESKSKPDVGIVRTRISVINQHDELVLTYFGTTMVQKRPV